MATVTHMSNRFSATCSTCKVQPLCLTQGLDRRQCLQVSSLTQHHQSLPAAQESLFWTGDEFTNIYAVRNGCLKTCTVDDEGHEHIRGFHLPGDMIGLDAIFSRRYPSSAVAVMPSEVCVIPYATFTSAVSDVPALQQSLLAVISRDLCISLALSGGFTAEQRVAGFLLHLYQRMNARGLVNGNSIHLPMPRRDIAGYLRLAIETVSRVLSRFEREDWIEISVRDLRLLDARALWRLAEPVGICEMPEPQTQPRRIREPLRRAGYVLSEARV